MEPVTVFTKPAAKENATTTGNTTTNPPQIRIARRSAAYWRVTIDNPPINVMGPEMVRQFQEVIDALEADERVRVAVFDTDPINPASFKRPMACSIRIPRR